MLDLQKLMGQMQGMSEQLQREAQQLTVKLDHSVFIIVLNSFVHFECFYQKNPLFVRINEFIEKSK